MEKRVLTEEILKTGKFTLENSLYTYINMGVWVVMKCNFNDEMLVKSLYLNVNDLKDKPLVWHDLYLGRNGEVSKKIAFLSLSGRELSFIVDYGEKKEFFVMNGYDFLVDDNGETTLTTTKISLHEKKENWW